MAAVERCSLRDSVPGSGVRVCAGRLQKLFQIQIGLSATQAPTDGEQDQLR